jgi:hypothetical protein
MADLRGLGVDLESRLDPPAFEGVHARVRRIRRRRSATMTAVAAVVVLLALVGLTRGLHTNRSAPPVTPAPTLDPEGARRVLADPDAEVDTDNSRVDGAGAMLAMVGLSGRTGDGCARDATALRWTGPGASARSWLDVARRVEALPSGFVVAASHCPGSDHPAYLVDGEGVTHAIRWRGAAASVCAARPDDPRCSFDEQRHTGTLADVELPAGTHLLATDTRGPLWAVGRDDRRLWWSTDGHSWTHHDATFPHVAFTSASAAGRHGILVGGTTVDATDDGGATWHRRDLAGPLSGVRTGDVDWTVLADGNLLGETQLVGRGDVLFRSTDPSWTRFVDTPVRTDFGLVRPTVEGDAVYVVDQERYAVSLDGGAHWRRTPPLP